MTATAVQVTGARAAALDWYRSQLGTVERFQNRCPYNQWYYGRDESAPWCATFASNGLWVVGAPIPATTAKGFAYVPSGVEWAKNNGRWKPNRADRHVGDPADLAVFSFGGQRPDHIEVVEARDKTAGHYINIGGNTSRPGGGGSQRDGGGVWRRARASKLIGFIVPPYPAAAPLPIPVEATNRMFYIIETPGNKGRWLFFPDMGERGRKAILPSGAADDAADNQKGFQGRLILDGPDLDAIPALRDK